MIYNSFNFLILYPFLFLAYYIIPGKYAYIRNSYLLIVSYLLYMNFNAVYALILLWVTIVTFISAKRLEKYGGGNFRKSVISQSLCLSDNLCNSNNSCCQITDVKTPYSNCESINLNVETSQTRKRALGGWLYVGCILSLLPLLFFKYYNFINEIISSILEAIGLNFQLTGLNWAIPVGISFYTFQALGYLWDVRYGRIQVENNFLNYALFVGFFPSIVSGPINKAALMIPQIKSIRPYFDYAKAVDGLKLLLWGMFMKVVVAVRVALYVDTVFSHYNYYSGLSCFIASLLYTIQIYADFAGYSLMAIGVGKTLGFNLTENFRRPYFAHSITDFWRRWHISLSTWLKEYIYIPLGGSRCSKLRNYLNILITFLVSGIWHGANWTFVIWGVLHGLFQIVEKATNQQGCKYGIKGKLIKIIVTFILVNFAWIFFRMQSLYDACCVIGKIFAMQEITVYLPPEKTNVLLIIFSIVILFIKDFLDEYYADDSRAFIERNTVIRWAMYIICIITILLTGVFDASQFIYVSF